MDSSPLHRDRRVAPRRLRAGALAALATALPLGAAACSSSTSNAAASNKIEPLVVYAAEGYDSAVSKAFTQATGIPVNLDDDSTGPLVTKVTAEKNNPKWGLLWVDGDEAFASLDQQGLLLRGWEPQVSWNSQGQAVLPKDGSYIPTGVTMAGTVVYDATKVSSPPSAWSDLLKPQWKGQVGMNDPAVSGPTYPFVAGMMNSLGGVSQGEQFFTSLKNNGLVVHQTNGDTLQALQTGQIKLAVIQSSAGIGAESKDPNIKVAFLTPVTPIPGAIGIDGKADATQIAEAKRFVQFVLSPQGQQAMQSGDPTGDSLYWPVIDGVTPLPALPPITSVPSVAIDPVTWGAREASVNSWFTANIVG